MQVQSQDPILPLQPPVDVRFEHQSPMHLFLDNVEASHREVWVQSVIALNPKPACVGYIVLRKEDHNAYRAFFLFSKDHPEDPDQDSVRNPWRVAQEIDYYDASPQKALQYALEDACFHFQGYKPDPCLPNLCFEIPLDAILKNLKAWKIGEYA